jgi:hypothetical protein
MLILWRIQKKALVSVYNGGVLGNQCQKTAPNKKEVNNRGRCVNPPSSNTEEEEEAT